MKHILKITLILFLTQSCTSDGYKKDFDSRISDNQIIDEKAIIITMVDTSFIDYACIKFDTEFVKMNWLRNAANKTDILHFNPYTKKKLNNLHNFYISNPDLYYLDDIGELSNESGFITELPLIPFKILLGAILGPVSGNILPNKLDFHNSHSGWNKKLNAPNFASFETKPGEIVYIGDLYFTFTKQKYWIRGKINLEVQDNYDEAVKYFHYKHPEFKNKPVVKRLVKPGVLLDNYDAGIFW